MSTKLDGLKRGIKWLEEKTEYTNNGNERVWKKYLMEQGKDGEKPNIYAKFF